MLRQGIGCAVIKRRPVNQKLKHLVNWTKSGSVTDVHEEGRNCLKLRTKKRVARIRIRPNLVAGVRYKASVDVFTPLFNGQTGIGTLQGETRVNCFSQGRWRRLEAAIKAGDEMIVEATGWKRAADNGDYCLVDLGSVKIETDNQPIHQV